MKRTITVPVKGMHCASCVAKVERAVKRAGYSGSANLTTATVSVILPESSETQKALEKIERELSKAGYAIDLDVIEIKVDGIEYLPADKIERALRQLEGVRDVKILTLADTIVVEHIPTITSAERIKAVVERFCPSVRVERKVKDEVRKWFAVSVVLSIPVILWYLLKVAGVTAEWAKIPLLALTTAIVLGPARVIAIPGLKNLARFSPDMNSLVTVSILSAFAVSVVNAFAGGEMWFETVAILTTVVLGGRVLEAKAKRKVEESFEKVTELLPSRANVLKNGELKEVSVFELSEGDVVFVREGERIPADGKVVEGSAEVDESFITGESKPVRKKPFDDVFASSTVISGSLKVKVSRSGEQAFVSQIVALARRAETLKPSVQKTADRISGVFTYFVFAVATAVLVGWTVAGEGFLFALERAITVLAVACPCALGLATPTAIAVASAKLLEKGVVIKDGRTIEVARKVKTVAFDKTGTLTEGRMSVVKVEVFEGFRENELVFWCASAELPSSHPIARALVGFAKEKGIQLEEPEEFFTVPGKGVFAILKGKKVLVGKKEFVTGEGDDGAVWVSVDGKPAGRIILSDRIKPEAFAVVEKLKRFAKVVILSGDSPKNVREVAQKLGVEWKAPLKPEEKAVELEKFPSPRCMVGDGINDAPALLKAHVSFSVARGTDVARLASNVVLLRDDLELVPAFFEFCGKVLNVIRQNLFWAFAYNVVLIPLAGGVVKSISLSPEVGAVAMSASSILVVSNSLRIKRFKFHR